LISQLTTYGIIAWLVFITIAFLAAYLSRFWGIIAGHILIALIVAALDLHWIHAEMRKPGWDGQPDQDIVFTIGLLIRIILINTSLLPASALGRLSRRASRTRHRKNLP
jgi:hypothetical protein